MAIPVGTKIRVPDMNEQTEDYSGEYEVIALANNEFEEDIAIAMFGQDAVRVLASDGSALIFIKGEYEVIENG